LRSLSFDNNGLVKPSYYNVIRIWAMSGPFSRFLVIFYPSSPCNPFQKCFSAHFHFCEQPR
jgi:hypothetical protein